MAVDYEKVNRDAKHYADAVRGIIPIERVILFGSYAKGTATEYSDVDICFFMKTFGLRSRIDILETLLGLTGEYGSTCFEPTVFPISEIQNGNPFVNEILRTGLEI